MVEWSDSTGFPFFFCIHNGINLSSQFPSQLGQRISHCIIVMRNQLVLIKHNQDVPIGIPTGIASSLRTIKHGRCSLGQTRCQCFLDAIQYLLVHYCSFCCRKGTAFFRFTKLSHSFFLFYVSKTASPSIHVGTEGDVVCSLFRKTFCFCVKVYSSSFNHNLLAIDDVHTTLRL